MCLMEKVINCKLKSLLLMFCNYLSITKQVDSCIALQSLSFSARKRVTISPHWGYIPFSSRYITTCNFVQSGQRAVAVLHGALSLTCVLSFVFKNPTDSTFTNHRRYLNLLFSEAPRQCLQIPKFYRFKV